MNNDESCSLISENFIFTLLFAKPLFGLPDAQLKRLM